MSGTAAQCPPELRLRRTGVRNQSPPEERFYGFVLPGAALTPESSTQGGRFAPRRWPVYSETPADLLRETQKADQERVDYARCRSLMLMNQKEKVSTGNRMRILVVDDEQYVTELVKRTLEDAGYVVTVANDGNSALTMLAEREPDLVLLDIRMPGFDGYQVLERIREGSDVPVLCSPQRPEQPR
ncbi:MAG: response regulator [Dehalococcoidales bacterium]|nr:response regulator [Dehalococcoidales bacterium]